MGPWWDDEGLLTIAQNVAAKNHPFWRFRPQQNLDFLSEPNPFQVLKNCPKNDTVLKRPKNARKAEISGNIQSRKCATGHQQVI